MAEDDPRQTLEPSCGDTPWITEILRSVGSMTIVSYCFNPLATTLHGHWMALAWRPSLMV